ncbi:uncharacterized protein IL334_006789 [Kwoniella shivajii]|uniref:Rab-GAP TBC domain-containing protein n=1 Tax=Kwoniella shivajii TaxID=564305 RepID=A0ABZ1D7A3_9TREE|nr:hypothetical protein IL334_006789 [Kwoniella shivajii]
MTQNADSSSSRPASPTSYQLPPSTSPNGDISLEASLSNISLGSRSSSSSNEAGPSRSPHISNERRTPPAALDLKRDDEIGLDIQGDIGVSLTSPTRASSPIQDYFSVSPTPHRSNSLAKNISSHSPSPSPSPSRAHQRSLTPNGCLEVSPTKMPSPSPTSLSPPLSAPPSRRSFSLHPSRSPSPSPSPSPRSSPPPPFNLKPTLRNGTSITTAPPPSGVTGTDADEVIDESAPFESIPLSATPPMTPTIPPPLSPSYVSPEKKGRQSWGGFGMTKEGQRYALGETPDHTRAQTEQIRRSSATSSILSNADKETNGTPPPANSSGNATPRLHAPPAHPFPFPLPSSSNPTSPPPSDHKRLSTSSSRISVSQPSIPHENGISVKGVSTFEKFISHTRPSWLPPKDKHEDETHLHQWEEMMAASREHEKQLKKAAEHRRIEKEKKMAVITPKWEKLLNDKEFSVGKVQSDEQFRKLWFEGIPSHLRGKAWSLAIGNPLAVSKDAYRTYVIRAQKAIKSGRFPEDILDQMEVDMDDTLTTLRLFHRGSPLREDLKELMCAWVVYRSDEGLGYAPYISLLSAMLILVSPLSEAFTSLINLLSRPCLRAFYTQTEDEIDAYYRVLENLQADAYPKIYANCKNLGLRVPEGWFRGMLVEQVDFECACRLWDQIMLDGDGFIFRTALAIFGFLEPRLYYPDRNEILSVLEGHNAATLAIQAREKERAKLRGETFDDSIDGKLSVFGLNEQTLFDWLKEDAWKEKGFERLVLREMPD